MMAKYKRLSQFCLIQLPSSNRISNSLYMEHQPQYKLQACSHPQHSPNCLLFLKATTNADIKMKGKFRFKNTNLYSISLKQLSFIQKYFFFTKDLTLFQLGHKQQQSNSKEIRSLYSHYFYSIVVFLEFIKISAPNLMVV